jgi:hypothetical protein
MSQCKLSGAIAFLAASISMAQSPTAPGPVVFNQDLLQRWWTDSAAPSADTGADAGELRERPRQTIPATLLVDYDDPDSVLKFILTAAGAKAQVYPTERYFYYKFDLGARRVSGNLRFTDVEDSVLHIGYFDDFDAQGSVKTKSYHHDRDISLSYDAKLGTETVEFRELRTTFHLNQVPRTFCNEIALDADEAYVAGVLDESGHSLHLVFNKPETMFYFIRAARHPSPERFADYTTPGGHSLKVGLRSRFVFFVDETSGREVLVGVYEDYIIRNTYFDGPFDQVPPRLDLRAMLESAYPYVKFGQGIDEHGNFIGLEFQRVAISPYQSYSTLPALAADLDKLYRPFATGTARWAMLTYEWKRDFHKTVIARTKAGSTAAAIADVGYIHNAAISIAWPANHWAEPSGLWSGHDAALSRTWPPNHVVELSRVPKLQAATNEAETAKSSSGVK